jgi:hypothetical protein
VLRQGSAVRERRRALARGLLLLGLFLTGCSSGRERPLYHDAQGLRFTPPAGWVERARPDALPGSVTQGYKRGKGHLDVPLPPLRMAKAGPERLMARYDRLTTGRLAWLRVAVADLPASLSLTACVTSQTPGSQWKRLSDPETLEVGGQPAARIAYKGPWEGQEYVCETVATRKGGRVYFLSAAFPAEDAGACEQVRQTVATAVWE